LNAQTKRIESIANNIANVNTYGYKQTDLSFHDLIYRVGEDTGLPVSANSSYRIGQGVKVGSGTVHFAQGALIETGRTNDFAIQGEGFFRIQTADGESVFTRSGAFHWDSQKNLVNELGETIMMGDVPIPPGTDSFSVSPQGRIDWFDDQGQIIGQGQVLLYRFANPQGLEAVGNNQWRMTENSGEPEVVNFADGNTSIRQRFLEASNVNLIEEMVKLMMTQRAFEINSKSLQTGNDMWELANNMKK
jgi:flagellar basal-body rod protein FlgG